METGEQDAHVFPRLGVRVRDGTVFENKRISTDEYGDVPLYEHVFAEGDRLGPLAGARAELTAAGRTGKSALKTIVVGGGIGLLAGFGKRASAFIIFADTSMFEQKLKGLTAIQEAQGEVIKLNALARASSEAAARPG